MSQAVNRLVVPIEEDLNNFVRDKLSEVGLNRSWAVKALFLYIKKNNQIPKELIEFGNKNTETLSDEEWESVKRAREDIKAGRVTRVDPRNNPNALTEHINSL